MFSSSVVPVTVHGRSYGLQWTFDAVIAAEQVFGFPPDAAKFAEAVRNYGAAKGRTALFLAFGFCMLQSADEPPTLKELGRMVPPEIGRFMEAVQRAMDVGVEGSLGKEKAVAAKPAAEAASASPGTGARRSRRRSTAVASPRPSSSSSPPSISA